MSGFVCVYAVDDSDALGLAFRRICDAAAYHGPDGCRSWSSGPVALGHVALRTTPESDLESQPSVTRDGSCLSFDGRLDNRPELLHLLTPSAPECVTDVDLVLAAYQRWGEECVDHFVGDYAFVLWDERAQRLFCARDPLGVRPFYYARLGGTLYAASGLAELMRSGSIPFEINEAIVAEYLTGEVYSTSDTLYRNVHRLPPGHRLTVDRQGVRVSRYWYPDRIPESRLTPNQAVERFRELFEQAVRACARSNRPFAAQLSGGLDSSSIVSVLSDLRGRGLLPQAFEAFTMTFPGLPCDESNYAGAVASRHGLVWNRVCTEPLPPVDYEALARQYLDFPGYPNGVFLLRLAGVVRDQGKRVLLSGSGGDEWLNGAPTSARTIDFLLNGQWRELRAEWRGSTAATELAAAARQLLAHRLDRWELPAARRAVRRRRLPRWILPSLVRRTDLAARMSPPIQVPSSFSWSRARRLHVGTNGAYVHSMEVLARMYAHLQLEERYPFYDRRLIEFFVSLPERYCGNGGVDKWLLREALRGLLPELVRTRNTKGEFSYTLRRTLDTPGARRIWSTCQRDRSWVDGALAERELDRFLRGETQTGLWSLWGAYGIHVWAQALPG